MSGPNVDGIIEKAKQLCRLDGMLWSSLDFQNPMAIQSRTARMASDADRRRYLKRTQTLLETQTAPLIVRHAVFCTMPIAAPDGSVLNSDSRPARVVIQGLRLGGDLDSEATFLVERRGVESG
jgi:hypothetical protein